MRRTGYSLPPPPMRAKAFSEGGEGGEEDRRGEERRGVLGGRC